MAPRTGEPAQTRVAGERTGVDPADQARTRRRFVRRQRARRWLKWRPVLAALLVVALVAAGVWLVFFSRVLAAQSVEVEGLSVLSEQRVVEAAAVPLNEPLAQLNVDAIATRVGTLPPVASVEVLRAWPDAVRILVTERQPVAVVKTNAGFSQIDAEGVRFRDVAKRPKALPLIVAAPEAGADAVREGAAVAAALPTEVLAITEHLEVASLDQITLQLTKDRSVQWGSAEDSALKVTVLQALLKQRIEPRPSTYDVSVPGQPTTR